MDELRNFAIVWGALISTYLLILRVLEKRPLIKMHVKDFMGDPSHVLTIKNISSYPLEVRDVGVVYPRKGLQVAVMQFSIEDELEREVHNSELNILLEPGGVVDIDLVFSGDELPAFFVLAVHLSRHRGMVLPYVPHLVFRRRSQLIRLRPKSERRRTHP